MTQKKMTKPNETSGSRFDGILRFSIGLSVIVMLVSCVGLLLSSKPESVWASSILSLASLLCAIAFTMILRRKSLGLLLLTLTLAIAPTAHYLACSSWLSGLMGSMGRFFPFIIAGTILLLTLCCIFVKSNGVSIWEKFRPGLIKHSFRHIYQVSFFFFLLIVTATWLKLSGNDDEGKDDGLPVETSVDLSDTTMFNAVALLKDANRATEGLDMLTELVEDDNADATYLLSRLYFKSLSDGDYCPDSVRIMQKNLHVVPDLNRSHQLLLKTISLCPTNYFALYELGCDFLGGDSRTTAVGRDIEKADQYFQQALVFAKDAGDSFYIERIRNQINKYKAFFEQE